MNRFIDTIIYYLILTILVGFIRIIFGASFFPTMASGAYIIRILFAFILAYTQPILDKD